MSSSSKLANPVLKKEIWVSEREEIYKKFKTNLEIDESTKGSLREEKPSDLKISEKTQAIIEKIKKKK